MSDSTILAFYEDFYRTELDASIDEYLVDEKFGPCLILDRTIFHPHGGGQKGDRGTIELLEEAYEGCPTELAVVDTRGTKTGRVYHVIDRQLDAQQAKIALLGLPVRMELNWEFRSTQMRLHSTAHLIHALMERSVGKPLPYPSISDIQDGYGLNVYEKVLDLSPDEFARVVDDLNSFLIADHSISTAADPTDPTLRTWKCDSIEIPCGGTHPSRTLEIGRVTATMSSKKGQTKVKFEVGPRV